MEYNTLRGVIFDLDGTLLDSLEFWNGIDARLLQSFGQDYSENDDVSAAVRKMSTQETAEYFIRRFHLTCTTEEFSARTISYAKSAYAEELQLKDDAIELLDWLDSRGIRYGVATATHAPLAKTALERFGIWARLAFFLTEEEIGASKSSPNIFREGAARLGLGRRQVVVVDDSLHAIASAKSAGFFTVAMYDRANDDEWQEISALATTSIHRLGELRNVLGG